MWPYLEIAGQFLPTHNIFLVGGVFVGLIVLFTAARRKRVALTFLADYFFVLFFFTMLFARLVEVLLYQYELKTFFTFWFDTGFNFYGGVIGYLLTLFIICRMKSENFFCWLDFSALTTTTTLVFHYLGTFAAGSMYGVATRLPWGVTFTNPDSAVLTTLPIHPTQIYATFVTLILFLISIVLFKHTRIAGKTGIFLLLTLSLAYFLNDFLRGDSAPKFLQLRASQYFSLGFIFFASLLMFQYYYAEKHARRNELAIPSEVKTDEV